MLCLFDPPANERIGPDPGFASRSRQVDAAVVGTERGLDRWRRSRCGRRQGWSDRSGSRAHGPRTVPAWVQVFPPSAERQIRRRCRRASAWLPRIDPDSGRRRRAPGTSVQVRPRSRVILSEPLHPPAAKATFGIGRDARPGGPSWTMSVAGSGSAPSSRPRPSSDRPAHVAVEQDQVRINRRDRRREHRPAAAQAKACPAQRSSWRRLLVIRASRFRRRV